jgi:hypothetical protein
MKKWANELNIVFSKEKSPNGQKKKAHKEMLNISGHEVNGNQNHIKSPPHTC